MTEIIIRINEAVSHIVWGWPAVGLLAFVGVLTTWLTGFFQLRYFAHWMRQTIGAVFREKNVTGHTGDGTISQFQSLCTALASTVGTGNMVGVAGAIAAGGPGSIFWMWLIAFFGMMTHYSENVLGILYRQRDAAGEWHGGAMYYLAYGLGKSAGRRAAGALLAALFSFFCLLASFGIGNMSQVNSIVSNVNTVFGVPAPVVGAALTAVAGGAILGGLQRIARVTEKLVPFMVILYLSGSAAAILIHITAVPAALAAIFKGAFSLRAAAGGGFGAGLKMAVQMGLKRGIFSNEAGLGSSVMAHSSSNVREPVRQGMWGIFEVFADTMVVCTLTALTVLTSGAVDLTTGLLTPAGEAIGSDSLVAYAFSLSFGDFGAVFIALSIFLFAYSTILGWSHYGATACRFLFGEGAVFTYRIAFVTAVWLGSLMKAQLVWDISDTFNGLMMLPNLIGLLALSPTVAACTRSYIRRVMG